MKLINKAFIILLWFIVAYSFSVFELIPSLGEKYFLKNFSQNLQEYVYTGKLVKFTSALILASLLDIWLEKGIFIHRHDVPGFAFKILVPIFIFFVHYNIQPDFNDINDSLGLRDLIRETSTYSDNDFEDLPNESDFLKKDIKTGSFYIKRLFIVNLTIFSIGLFWLIMVRSSIYKQSRNSVKNKN